MTSTTPEHRGFSDHRIRDVEDYDRHVHYIHLNPVKKHLCVAPPEYRFSSAFPGWELDPIPQWLKPLDSGLLSSKTEVVPFENVPLAELHASTRRDFGNTSNQEQRKNHATQK